MAGSPQPTNSELAILDVLWRRGPSTVRDVFEVLQQQKDVGYTTILKTMQNMHGKSILHRDDARRPHIYWHAQPPESVQEGLIASLARRAFGGSAANLVLRALSGGTTSRSDLRAIRDLIDEMEARRGEE